MRPILRILLSALLAAVGSVAWPLTYPTSPEVARAQYQQLALSLSALPQPSPEQLACADVSLRGKVVEIRGALQSSMFWRTREGDPRYVFLLQTETGITVALTANESLEGVRLNDPIRVLASLPANSDQSEFHLHGILREADWVAPAPKVAPSPPAPAPPSPAEVTVAPPPPPAPAKSGFPPPDQPVWDGVSADAKSCPAGMPDVGMSQEDINRWKEWVARYNKDLTDVQLELTVRWVIAYSALAGIDHRLSFAMIRAESDFHPLCLSRAGAMGMTQLMPCNLEDMNVTNPWNVQQNIRGGIQLLSKELHKFADRSNYEQCILGLAAYNAGPGAVKKYGGVPPYAETQNYVKKVSKQFLELVQAGYP